MVDDSAYVRKVLSYMLQAESDFRVVGTASDGIEALRRVEELKPDLVTVDLEMPQMNGVEFITEQMRRNPLPIIVVSSVDQSGVLAGAALLAGAVEFVHKPTKLASSKLAEIREGLISKVRMAVSIEPSSILSKVSLATTDVPTDILRPETTTRAIVIGVSTGGPQALNYILPSIPNGFPIPIGVVIHMPVGFTESLATRLNGRCDIEVTEASRGAPFTKGCLIGKAGLEFGLTRTRGTVVVSTPETNSTIYHTPSVDGLFRTASEVYGPGLVSLVLTGMGSDGQEGAAWVKAAGGLVYTQSERSCVVYGMPRSVVESGLSDGELDLEAIPDFLKLLAEA